MVGEPFQGSINITLQTQGSRKLEPWAEISERLRRYRGQSQTNALLDFVTRRLPSIVLPAELRTCV
jgi:hypothetical protein